MTNDEMERLAYASGDVELAGYMAQIVELEAQVETLESQVETLEEQLSDAQDNSLAHWEKNNGPASTYKQFFDDCFQRLSGHYPCPSVTSDHDKGVVFAAIERGEGVTE